MKFSKSLKLERGCRSVSIFQPYNFKLHCLIIPTRYEITQTHIPTHQSENLSLKSISLGFFLLRMHLERIFFQKFVHITTV
eukprot:snap_masked-scaffold_59-processed-gene-0.23-mRNA-1 protein AED:1.00 eAED:1.00 QI:0/0/0/0/1/1/4/0/80